MFLEMDNSKLTHQLGSAEALRSKVDKVVAALHIHANHEAQQSVTPSPGAC